MTNKALLIESLELHFIGSYETTLKRDVHDFNGKVNQSNNKQTLYGLTQRQISNIARQRPSPADPGASEDSLLAVSSLCT